MQKSLFLTTIACLGLMLGCKSKDTLPSSGAQSSNSALSSSQTIKTAPSMTIKVSGMTCTGCEQTIKSALSSLEGVQSVQANHKTGMIQIQTLGDPSKIKGPVMMALAKTDYVVENFQIDGP